MTDGEANTLAARGLEELLFQLCCCVSFWFWREIGFGLTYYLCIQITIQLWCCVSFLVLVGNTFWCYVLSVQYSCAVVSVFWFWQEIILKMRTSFYKKILLGYFIVIRYLLGFFILEKQLVSQDMFLIRSELSITVYLFLALYRSTSLQSLSCLKNIETFLCKWKLVNNCSIPSK